MERNILLLGLFAGTGAVAAPEEHVMLQTKVTGSGQPLVLVPGGITGWLSWEPHAERLQTSRRVVRVQLLSVQWGLEGKPLPADYSVRTESEALAASIAGLTGPADLVAWSYGGLVALDYALRHRDRVRSLTLIEPPALWVLQARGEVDADSRRAIATLEAVPTDHVSEEQMASFVCAVGLCPAGTDARQLPNWPVLARHRQSVRNSRVVAAHRDEAARLAALDLPVLLVKGTGSATFLHRCADALNAALPRAKSIEMPGGHAPQIVSMQQFLDELKAFHREVAADEGRRLARRFWEEVINEGNVAALDEFVAADYIQHQPDVPPGREGLKSFVRRMAATFPDQRATIEDILFDGDRVMTRTVVTATHSRPFRGHAPTGKRIHITVMDVWRIAEGRFAEHWGLIDGESLDQQLASRGQR